MEVQGWLHFSIDTLAESDHSSLKLDVSLIMEKKSIAMNYVHSCVKNFEMDKPFELIHWFGFVDSTLAQKNNNVVKG